MALRGTLTHRKTRRLALSLGIDPPEALGLMEALWNVAAEMRCPDGGVGRMSNDDLAMEMHSRRDGAALVAALVAAGLLEAVEGPDRLIVHDWHHHSDDTTDSKLCATVELYANGEMPRMTRKSYKERTQILARYAQKFGNSALSGPTQPESGVTARFGPEGALPEPEPEPVQRQVPSRGSERVRSSAPGRSTGIAVLVPDAGVERVYRAYPLLVGKEQALAAIRKAVGQLGAGRDRPPLTSAEALEFLHERVSAFARSPAGRAGRFTPHPATWFNAGRYLDDEGAWYAADRGDFQTNRGQQRQDSTLDALRRADEADRDSEAVGDLGSIA